MSLLAGLVGPQQDFLAGPADGGAGRGQVGLGGEVRDVLGSGSPAGRAACRLNASLQA
ncbi:hypothetical protein [Deinococcus sp. 23YEL01]|uniref:hypothetical protein n=1 Tax=Deinococcus sp. 23YEL01 TaxID=2745871 RepID=UPI001E51F2B1|nr:hypothetical protein [Deinococcus sp. 23YEL01]MCD0171420.1 hypothetical protein [Deinococcus sp. 23YEL01]